MCANTPTHARTVDFAVPVTSQERTIANVDLVTKGKTVKSVIEVRLLTKKNLSIHVI